jgi:hypothetical protein
MKRPQNSVRRPDPELPHMPLLAPRKVIIEVKFRAQLDFFAKMDNTAMAIIEKGFPDWRRGTSAIELQHRTKHRRTYLQASRLGYEFDAEPEAAKEELDLAFEACDIAFRSIAPQEVYSVAIRQFYALVLGNRAEQKLITILMDKFSPKQTLEGIIGLPATDVAYTLEFKDHHDNNARLILGAMRRKQWSVFVPYPDPEENNATYVGEDLQKILDAVPSDFVFVDLDRTSRLESKKLTSEEFLPKLKQLSAASLGSAKLLLAALNEKKQD